jgi:uncharacterized protein (TIGR03435 family)
VTAKEAPISNFADLLSELLDRPVVDMTGLTGNYSFVVYFMPEEKTPTVVPIPASSAHLQERLGLKT